MLPGELTTDPPKTGDAGFMVTVRSFGVGVGLGVGVGVGVGVGPPLHRFAAVELFLGAAAAAEKSVPFWSVSVQPAVPRMIAFVARGAGALAAPSLQSAVVP